MVKSGITKDELIDWGGQEVFNQALGLCHSGDVKEVSYNDDTLVISGKIEQPNGWPMPVSLKLMPGGRIKSMCNCRANRDFAQVCPHVVAIGIAQWVAEMELPEASASKPSSSTSSSPSSSPDSPTPPAPQPEYIEVPMKPRVFAYVSGTRASLSVKVSVRYGTVEFPACSLQPPKTVYLEDPDDPLVRRVRSMKYERATYAELVKWGFSPGYTKEELTYSVVDQSKVLTFLGAGVPELRRKRWRVNFSERLGAAMDDVPAVVPIVTIKDAPDGAFDVHYSFDAGGTCVKPVELQAALNRGDGYILRDGKPIFIDSHGIDSLREVFADFARFQNGAERDWFRVKGVYALYVKESLEELGCEVNASRSKARLWYKQSAQPRIGRKSDPRFRQVPLGPLDKILRPYQKQGVYWMRFLENMGFSGLLADEMGLGKTLQTLAWLTLPRVDDRGRDSEGRNLPALVVCPTSLVRNWEAEAKKFTPQLKTLVISGPDRARDFALIDDADLVISSYALVQRDFEAAYAGRNFSVVVLDEAQHIKNRQTRSAMTVKGLQSFQRLVITGTPVENSVADIWSIFDFLMPEYLGDFDTFKVNYLDPIAADENAERVLARLKRKVSPFILRRLKKTVAKDLPDKIIKVSYCPMSDDSQREYAKALGATRQAAGDLIKAKGFKKSRLELLALLMKLRQIASRAKIDTFMEQLDQAIDSGHKVLVFSQFVKMLSLLEKRLQEAGIPYCYLDGSTKDRLGQCEKFNRSKQIPVFLISLKAGGTGLNLTGADMVMHYDPWWNPAVEDQATDRAHRIGQKKNVYVMKMIASGTIEEKVLELQRRKQAIIKATVDTTDTAVMEKLTAEDLNELLS